MNRDRVNLLQQEFRRVSSNPLLQKVVFGRMHLNRLLQSFRIIAEMPLIWRKVVGGFFSAVTGKKNRLRSLEIALTYRCNAHCVQCSCRLAHDPVKEQNQLLTLEELKETIDQAVALGAFQFTLNGGEPLLEEQKVYALTRYIKHRRHCYVHLCSNGTFLSESKIAILKKYGLDSLELGLDSFTKEEHDRNRVAGSYDCIIDIIRWCKKYRIRVILNTILTNENVCSGELLATVFFAKKMGCLLQITPCCLTGAFKGRTDLMLTPVSRLYFHWLLSLSVNNRSDLYSSLTSIRCPAAREKIGIQPYGDIVSCPLIQIPYGNIRECSLKDAQKTMLENPYYSLKETQGCLPSMSEEFIRKYLLS